MNGKSDIMVLLLINLLFWKSVVLLVLSWKLNCGFINLFNIMVNMVCMLNFVIRNLCLGFWGFMVLFIMIKWCWVVFEYKSVFFKFLDNCDMFKFNVFIGWLMRLLFIWVLILEDGVVIYVILLLVLINISDEKFCCMFINDRVCVLN